MNAKRSNGLVRRRIALGASVAVAVFVAGCGSNPSRPNAAIPAGGIKPEDLYIVDCLLQSQVRQVGEGFTYLAPRRPIRTTARDCAIRGGEYVAFDRANSATALKVWLQAANAGDANAQTIVGEIYEQGLGIEPQHDIARSWFEKAAAQGDSRAMLNLGAMYESGRGVAKDPVQAMNWYRKASGLTDGQLELTTDAEVAERRALASEANRLRTEVLNLKSQLDTSRDQLKSRQDEVQRSRSELQRLREQMQKQDAAQAVDPERIQALEAQIAVREVEISRFQRATEELIAQMGTRGTATAAAAPVGSGPAIQVISPDVVPTRAGVAAATVFSDITTYDVIGRVRSTDELLAFRVNDRDYLASLDDSGLFQIPIEMGQTNTPVSIEAVAKNGERSVQSFVIARESLAPVARRNASRPLMRRLSSDLGQFHALVIGNNNYREFPNLETAVNDAQAVSAELRDRYGYQVQTLLNADKTAILRALADYTQKLGNTDNLLIYYAGHGQIDPSDGKGYWVPVDGGATDTASWLGNEAITQFLGAMNAKHVLVVADSCYAGTLSGSAITPIPVEVADEDLLFVSRVKARAVLASGGLQPVSDRGPDGHSVFAGAFLQALRQNNNLMEGYLLYRDVQQRIGLMPRINQLQQNPEYSALKHAGHEGSEFFFLPKDAA